MIRSFFADWKCRPPCFGSLLLTALFVSGAAIADEFTCGPLTSAFGPFDYRTAKPFDIKIVEDYHFTREVETLKSGSTSYLAWRSALYPHGIPKSSSRTCGDDEPAIQGQDGAAPRRHV